MAEEQQEEKVFVPIEEAVRRLDVRDGRVHTFREGGPCLIIGADWDLEDLVAWMRGRKIEETGPGAQSMNHGLAGHDEGGPMFIATRQTE